MNNDSQYDLSNFKKKSKAIVNDDSQYDLSNFIKKTPDGKIIGQVNNHLIMPSEYNYDSLVIFTADDIWEINTAAKRASQIPEATRLVQDFYNTFGRIPTHQEMDMLYTKITKVQ